MITNIVVLGAVNVLLVLGVFAIFSKKLGGASKTLATHIIDIMIRNKELRTNIFKKLDEIEANMGTEDGARKMDVFASWAGLLVPGDMDDKIIRQVCQGIYEGWKLSKGGN
jgi:hypothetical protein